MHDDIGSRKTKKEKRGVNVITIWLASYLLVFLIPMTVCLAFVLHSSRTLEAEVASANTGALTNIQVALDNDFNAAIKMGNVIAANVQVQTILNNTSDYYARHIYDISKLQKELKSYLASNESVKDFYIFLTDGSILSSEMYINSKYLDIMLPHLSSPYPLFMDILSVDSSSRFWSLPLEGGRQQIAYVCNITHFSASEGTRVILLMNDAKISNFLVSTQQFDSQYIMVMDFTGNVIASNREVDGDMLETLARSLEDGGVHYEKDGYVVSAVASKAAPLYYVSVTPRNLFYANYLRMRTLMIYTFSLALLAGVVLVALSVRYNYKPLDMLIKYINASGDRTSKGKGIKEYELIGRAYDNILSTADEYLITVKKQNDILRSEFLSRLLHGFFSGVSFNTVTQLGKAYGINFISDRFAVGVIGVLETENPGEEEWPMPDSYVQRFIISNIVQELAGEKNRCFMADDGNIFACLVNFEPESGADMLADAFRQAEGIIKKSFHFNFIAVISGVHTGVSEISTAFYEASFAMDSLLRRDCGGGVILAGEIPGRAPQRYEYSSETAGQIANLARLGEYDKLKQAVERAAAPYMSQHEASGFSAAALKLTMLEIACAIIKEDSRSEGAMAALPQRIIFSHSAEETLDLLLSYARSACGEKRGESASPSNEIIDQAIAYVNKNYADNSLNVNSIAEHFGKHPVYFSSLFKEHTGMRLLDYISRTRLRRAKELISDSGVSLKEIALSTGFTDNNALIRAFKKFEGVTPGEYRQIVKEDFSSKTGA